VFHNLSRAALLGIVLFNVGFVLAAELRVPQQYGTIQGALDAAQQGDTVLVSPGTYPENLVIGKAVSLRSTGGARDTVIDGRHTAAVIIARGTGTERVTISGFTITNGFHGDAFQAGGIYLESVIAVIADNVIRNNSGCLGSGISTTTAAVTIERNRIADNPQDPACNGADGGGMFLNGDGAAPSRVANNIVSGHRIGGRGAGIAVQAHTNLTIQGNLITDNHTTPAGGIGGGIVLLGTTGVISANVLFSNSAEIGGGMALFSTDQRGPLTVSANVMGRNQASSAGSAIYLATFQVDTVVFTNNLVDSDSASALVYCDSGFVVPASNRLRNAGGPELGGGCEPAPTPAY
jgi:hypothetical protein